MKSTAKQRPRRFASSTISAPCSMLLEIGFSQSHHAIHRSLRYLPQHVLYCGANQMLFLGVWLLSQFGICLRYGLGDSPQKAENGVNPWPRFGIKRSLHTLWSERREFWPTVLSSDSSFSHCFSGFSGARTSALDAAPFRVIRHQFSHVLRVPLCSPLV